jgi:hypothetical protein
MGVVLGRRPLVDPELDAGTLVTLVDQPLRSPTAYWLVGLPETMTRPDIQAFRAWLIEELAAYPAHAAARPKAFALADGRGDRAASPIRARQRGGGR